MVASSQGVDTSRDVNTDNTTTSMTADGLIDCFHSIKAQYWPGLTWTFHRTAIQQIRKLKDSEGQYLWNPGLNGGSSNLILGVPYDVSEYMPNTFTTGLYVGLLCDWKYYWIADSLAFAVQRLIELYALTNQVGLIGRAETDGMPVLAEAFARVKLA
jgi:HK97 family phage major capsid protein